MQVQTQYCLRSLNYIKSTTKYIISQYLGVMMGSILHPIIYLNICRFHYISCRNIILAYSFSEGVLLTLYSHSLCWWVKSPLSSPFSSFSPPLLPPPPPHSLLLSLSLFPLSNLITSIDNDRRLVSQCPDN